MKHFPWLVVGILWMNSPLLRGEDSKTLERLQQVKNVRMIEMLDLTEDQSVRFFARLHEHNRMKEELKKEKSAGLEKIERLLRNRAADEELRSMFTEILAIDAKLCEQERNFFQSLQDLLAVEQQAKFLLFDRQFQKELFDSLNEIRRQRQGRSE